MSKDESEKPIEEASAIFRDVGEKIPSRGLGISLFSPDEEVIIENYGFEGQWQEFPDGMRVRLCGSDNSGSDYVRIKGREPMGITVIDGRIVKANANELKDKGLYDLGIEVDISSLQDHPISINCGLILPNPYLALDYTISSYGVDLLMGCFGKDSRGSKYTFFVPPDADFLSQLRFSFHSRIVLPPNA